MLLVSRGDGRGCGALALHHQRVPSSVGLLKRLTDKMPLIFFANGARALLAECQKSHIANVTFDKFHLALMENRQKLL